MEAVCMPVNSISSRIDEVAKLSHYFSPSDPSSDSFGVCLCLCLCLRGSVCASAFLFIDLRLALSASLSSASASVCFCPLPTFYNFIRVYLCHYSGLPWRKSNHSTRGVHPP